MEEQKESRIFTYTYSAMEKPKVEDKQLTKFEKAQVEKIRQEYMLEKTIIK